MKEYIEREAVLRETYKAQDELESNDDKVWRKNKPYFKGLAWANRIILDTPASDVVEVRHAYWKDDYNGTFVCSDCGGKASKMNWCGHCGAKMDEK